MISPLRINVSVPQVDRGPIGQRLGGAEGEVLDMPAVLTLTEQELHIAFTHVDFPALTINLMEVARSAVAAMKVARLGSGGRS